MNDHVNEPRSPQGNLPIEVGDLVMIVRGHNCSSRPIRTLGHIFTVTKVREAKSGKCLGCGGQLGLRLIAEGHPNGYPRSLWKLRKIPPLSREDSIETTKHEQMDIKV